MISKIFRRQSFFVPLEIEEIVNAIVTQVLLLLLLVHFPSAVTSLFCTSLEMCIFDRECPSVNRVPKSVWQQEHETNHGQ
jgi:hypothetical protein